MSWGYNFIDFIQVFFPFCCVLEKGVPKNTAMVHQTKSAHRQVGVFSLVSINERELNGRELAQRPGDGE